MTQIDPARISRIFRTLSTSAGSASAQAGSTRARPESKSAAEGRSPAILKSRIQSRLATLDNHEIGRSGPTITVQEVLRWEFGDEALDNSGFASVTDKVVSAMLEDPELSAALKRLVAQLAKTK